MAIKLNDSIRVQGAKPVEDKMLNNGVPYSSVAQAKNTIAKTDRYQSLTVIVNNGTSNEEWWWKDGVEDINLISKFSEEKDTLADVVNRGRISPLPIKFVDGTDLNYIEVGSKAPNNNIWFGNGLSLATTGEGNSAIGYNSLRSITTGNWNNTLGGNTLELLQTGRENVAVGDYAGGRLLTGSKNTFLGGSAASYNSGGLYNTMVGYSCNSIYKLGQSPVGDRNTFIGAHSGQGISGNNNVLIGVLAGRAGSASGLGTLNNKLVIHSHAGFIGTGGDSEGPNVSLESNLQNSLISGDFAERWVKFNGTFSIGPTHIPNADDTYTKNIVANADGTFGWEDKVVGQNIANSSLTSVTGAGMTLGTPYTWNTAGQPFYITNLPDKSSDNTFTKFKVQDDSGQEAVVNNPFEILKYGLTIMTPIQALELGQLLNGGSGSEGAMSVNLISPPVVQKIDSNEYILLRGANLNLNATSKKIEILDSVTKAVVDTVPDNQIQTYAEGTSLVFYYNFKNLEYKNYIFRLTSGVKVYETTLELVIVENVNQVPLDSTTWEIIYDSPSSDLGTNVYTGRNVDITTPIIGLANDVVKIALKSSEIFAQGDNFYLETILTVSAKSLPSNRIFAQKNYIGIGYSEAQLALANNSLVNANVNYTTALLGATRSNIFNNTNGNPSISPNLQPQTVTVSFIKTGNLFRTIVNGSNHSTTLANNSGYSIFMSFVGREQANQITQVQLTKAYTFN